MDSSKQRSELRMLFLTLWDKAVGTPSYDKHEWLEMEDLLGFNSTPPPERDTNPPPSLDDND